MLTYYRKMRQFDLVLRMLFTSKERYLLTKQHCFVLSGDPQRGAAANQHPNGEVSEAELESGREDGPKRSQAWWEELVSGQSWDTLRLVDGLT